MKLLATLLFLGAPAIASAQVVYDNGAPNGTFGLKIYEPFSAANDFRLTGPTLLTSFDFWAQFVGGSGPETVSANFYWQIIRDDGGRPTVTLAGQHVTGAQGTMTAQGTCCVPLPMEYQAYRFRTSLNNITLGAGTYWLAIGSFDAPNYQTGYFWANSQNGAGNESKRYTGSEWQTYPFEGAFAINGLPGNEVNIVPEPASLALLATGLSGLGGVGLVRRRKKK